MRDPLVFGSSGPEDLAGIRALLTASELEAGCVQESTEFIVARAGAVLAGVLGLERHGNAALLRSFAVASWARGHGTGHRLLQRALASAQAGGAQQVYLLTTTAPGYFVSRGFAECCREQVPREILDAPAVATQCPKSAICMSLDLGTAPPRLRRLLPSPI